MKEEWGNSPGDPTDRGKLGSHGVWCTHLRQTDLREDKEMKDKVTRPDIAQVQIPADAQEYFKNRHSHRGKVSGWGENSERGGGRRKNGKLWKKGKT